MTHERHFLLRPHAYEETVVLARTSQEPVT
jgi:hypothetical protein